MADEEFFKSLSDYDDIKEYLEESKGFEAPKPQTFQPDFSSAIVVDNLPIITEDKLAKLTNVVWKIYNQASASLNEKDIYIPFDTDANTSRGFCFIRFKTAEDAKIAVQLTQGYTMGKNVLKVTPYSDFEKYLNLPDVYVPPEAPAFKPRPDPSCYLVDAHCRDQFVIRYGSETEIAWANMTGEEPSKVYGGEREKQDGKVWCDSYVFWSPQGTYLATFHKQGVRLWGSANFDPQGRFAHTGVEVIDFSPCERYLITYRYAQSSDYDPAKAIIVWDVRSGVELRAFDLKNPLDPKFQVSASIWVGEEAKRTQRTIRGRIISYNWNDARGVGEFTIQEGNTVHKEVTHDVTPIQEPNRLKWSPDGNYVARLGCDIITVYDMPSMQILEKKSLAAKDVLEFVWSPRSNIISYWSPAIGNHPALINIISMPQRTEICSRKLFDVLDGKMVWQNDGDFLCVYMTKIQGKKKTNVLMFFRVREPEVPVEQLEINEQVISVAWEPFGERVAIVSGEARNATIAFYSMAKAGAKGKKELALLFTITGSQATEVLWSPAGGIAALVFSAPESCIFELHDVENNVQLASRKHDRGNRLVWDPSGRMIASCTITDLRHASARGHAEDGFVLYTFQGNLIQSVRHEKLFQFMWRPRPRDLIPSEEKKKIIKNLRKYEKIFEKEDRQRKQELNQEVAKARYRAAQDFIERLHRNRTINGALRQKRIMSRNGYDSDDERNYDIVTSVRQPPSIISSIQSVHSSLPLSFAPLMLSFPHCITSHRSRRPSSAPRST